MGQRNLKSPHEESSCVLLLTSAICSQRFRKLPLERKSLDFLSFFFFFLPKMKRGIFFSRKQRLEHAAISLLPFIGGLGGVNTEGCVVCWPWFGGAPSLGRDCKRKWTCDFHPLGQAGLHPPRAAWHRLANVDFECPTGRRERLPAGEKTEPKLNPRHMT